MHVRQDGHVDHAVVDDLNNRIIIESEEMIPLKCAADVLERCGVEFADQLRVCEVCRVSKY